MDVILRRTSSRSLTRLSNNRTRLARIRSKSEHFVKQYDS
ncbi:unnamed protein product, partial [Rotaria socialis]